MAAGGGAAAALAGGGAAPPSLAALRDLQREVGALLRFRDLVVDALPGLRERLLTAAADKGDWQISGGGASTRRASSSEGGGGAAPEWAPGVRVRRKLGGAGAGAKEKRASGCSDAVQDSGFGTEASSKETHSAGSTGGAPTTGNMAASATGTSDSGSGSEPASGDELWSLLDTIQRRGVALRDEVDALLRQRRHSAAAGLAPSSDFQGALFRASADDVRRVRRERDLLLDRLAEMEAEVLAGRLHAARLQDDLEQLLGAKHDLEDRLRAVVSQRGEVNSRIRDLHAQFVSARPFAAADRAAAADDRKGRRDGRRRSRSAGGALDAALGAELPQVRAVDGAKVAAILKEHDPLSLQKHLLTATVHNQLLQEHLDRASEVEEGLRENLNKVREENEDLRFQLEDKSIELEGTRARMRLLEDLHQKPKNGSPDIIPNVETPERERSRTEISTASMKAMTPLPMLEPSSSTESAHQERRGGGGSAERARRPPSRIPLKSYTAPKPPAPSTGPRSRSGGGSGSPHRSHSRTRSSADGSLRGSIGATQATTTAASQAAARSRNSSLVTARDSLTTKLRGADSLGRKREEERKQWPPRDEKARRASSPPTRRSRYPWTGSWCSGDPPSDYPDSLDRHEGDFRTANTSPWQSGECAGAVDAGARFYDSIDSAGGRSSAGEALADCCDSLDGEFSGLSAAHRAG